MSRFDALYQQELERLETAQAYLVEPGTEEEVLALHGGVLSLLDRVYFRINVTAAKAHIRVLPLICKEVPLGIGRDAVTLPWADIYWDERLGVWTVGLHAPPEEHQVLECSTLKDAVEVARKSLNTRLPLMMLRHRLSVPKVVKLTSIRPSRAQLELEAEWQADYWFSVEEECQALEEGWIDDLA